MVPLNAKVVEPPNACNLARSTVGIVTDVSAVGAAPLKDAATLFNANAIDPLDSEPTDTSPWEIDT